MGVVSGDRASVTERIPRPEVGVGAVARQPLSSGKSGAVSDWPTGRDGSTITGMVTAPETGKPSLPQSRRKFWTGGGDELVAATLAAPPLRRRASWNTRSIPASICSVGTSLLATMPRMDMLLPPRPEVAPSRRS